MVVLEMIIEHQDYITHYNVQNEEGYSSEVRADLIAFHERNIILLKELLKHRQKQYESVDRIMCAAPKTF